MPFVAFDKSQIQPASVDLRLSGKIWVQKRVPLGKIDVSENGAFDFISSKFWKEKQITVKKPLHLKPNETVFGRTHEIIAVPENCSAKIECKSSIARLSISVVYSDYCNPKYVGHYPLQIHNSGKNTVVLYPNMEICQLILVKLNDSVLTPYDSTDRKSIYAKYDDGSPTKWWDSKTNKKIREQLCAMSGTVPVDEIIEKVDSLINEVFDESVREHNKKRIYKRLHKFLRSKRITSVDQSYSQFTKREKQSHDFWDTVAVKEIVSCISTAIFLLPLYFINLLLELLKVNINLNSAINLITGKSAVTSQIISGLVSAIIIISIIVLLVLAIKKIYFLLSDHVASYLFKGNNNND